jgi:DNA-binding winged helix-turn-helix (wHTH) protein
VSVFEFGPFRFNEAAFELSRDGAVVHTERRVGDVLSYLIRHRARVVPNAELLAELWDKAHVTRASLSRAVLLLRKALDDEAKRPRWIQTAHGRGYRFMGAVRVHDPDRAPVASAPDPFVGRSSELALLEGLLHATIAGRGRLCLLSGSPGIGKSRLVQEVVARGIRLGMVALTSCCVDAEGVPSYWPWLQLLRAYVAGSSPDGLRSDLGSDAAILARTLPDLKPFLGRLDPDIQPPLEDGRFHFFDGVTRTLRARRCTASAAPGHR